MDEEGSEAAAATAIVVGANGAPVAEPVAVVVDSPFIYWIRAVESGATLFLGHVARP